MSKSTPARPLARRPRVLAVRTPIVSRSERYPVDTGLFVSGGMDGVVKVWDTNTLGVVLEFDFKDKVRAREKHNSKPCLVV